MFTFVSTLVFGVMPGLLLGIVASILLFITLNTRPYTAILGRLPNTNIFRNVEHFPEAETIPGLVILRIDASLYFANVVFLKERLHEICDRYEGELQALILDASAVNDLDSSADTALHQLSDEFKKKGITFYIAGVKAPVRRSCDARGCTARWAATHFSPSMPPLAVKDRSDFRVCGGDGPVESMDVERRCWRRLGCRARRADSKAFSRRHRAAPAQSRTHERPVGQRAHRPLSTDMTISYGNADGRPARFQISAVARTPAFARERLCRQPVAVTDRTRARMPLVPPYTPLSSRCDADDGADVDDVARAASDSQILLARREQHASGR